jgi:hypothetical protein
MRLDYHRDGSGVRSGLGVSSGTALSMQANVLPLRQQANKYCCWDRTQVSTIDRKPANEAACMLQGSLCEGTWAAFLTIITTGKELQHGQIVG